MCLPHGKKIPVAGGCPAFLGGPGNQEAEGYSALKEGADTWGSTLPVQGLCFVARQQPSRLEPKSCTEKDVPVQTHQALVDAYWMQSPMLVR